MIMPGNSAVELKFTFLLSSQRLVWGEVFIDICEVNDVYVKLLKLGLRALFKVKIMQLPIFEVQESR